MSALADALVAAQRRALAQLEKEFVRSQEDDADVRAIALREALGLIGLPDRTDADALIACLEVLRVTGGALPAEPTGNGGPKPDEPATNAQWTLIKRLCDERQIAAPDGPLTKAEASEAIERIKQPRS